jgi:hypothetical protein
MSILERFQDERALRCPFCDSIPDVTLDEDGDYRIRCRNEFCERRIVVATRWSKDLDTVLSWWNTRYYLKEPDV